MVSPLLVAGLAVPAVIVGKVVVGRGGSSTKPEEETRLRLLDERGDPSFLCERVCTSDRLMRRMGSLAKDVTPNTCVTVCGTSAIDACTEACQRAVCRNMHQVPAWNEACITRCSNECQRGRSL